MEQTIIQSLKPMMNPLVVIAHFWLSWHGITVLVAATLGFAGARYYLLNHQQSLERKLGGISISPYKKRRR